MTQLQQSRVKARRYIAMTLEEENESDIVADTFGEDFDALNEYNRIWNALRHGFLPLEVKDESN